MSLLGRARCNDTLSGSEDTPMKRHTAEGKLPANERQPAELISRTKAETRQTFTLSHLNSEATRCQAESRANVARARSRPCA